MTFCVAFLENKYFGCSGAIVGAQTDFVGAQAPETFDLAHSLGH